MNSLKFRENAIRLTSVAKYNKEKLLLTTLEVFMESQRMTAFINKIWITFDMKSNEAITRAKITFPRV